MPRTARASAGNLVYHVHNRGNARQPVFHQDDDYAAFVELIGDAWQRVPLRVVGYCLMPNHFHLVLWPLEDGDLSLTAGPVPLGRDWLAHVNEAQTEGEVEAIRRSIARGAPYGGARWQRRIARGLGLESSLRPRGRPAKWHR